MMPHSVGKQDVMSKLSNVIWSDFQSRHSFHEPFKAGVWSGLTKAKQINLSDLCYLHTNISKLSCELRIGFADKCMEK